MIDSMSIEDSRSKESDGAKGEISLSDIQQDQIDQEYSPNRAKNFWKSISQTAPSLFAHMMALILTLGSIWIIHYILTRFLGEEDKFFDAIPVRYIFDAANLAVIVKFLWSALKDFREDS